MRELTCDELEVVNGGFLANIGMGMAGATGGMAIYSLQGGISGEMSGAGFVGAAVGGFIYGMSGFNPAGAIAGAAIGEGAARLMRENES
jgi:hypothetical protein